jgi:SAM-dependent methyltransferase
MRLYGEFASWFHLLTAPEDYADEAADYLRVLTEVRGSAPRTLLELGSGGGNNASHLKAHVTCTLTDVSADMLAVSRTLNPECEHVQGDMRTLRLGRTFDAVLLHDAIVYMTTRADLRAAFDTAYAHCAPGGAVVVAPDWLRESFRAVASDGGHDGEGRALRYLQWTWDPDPDDETYVTDFVYMLREGKDLRVEHDQHTMGLFPRDVWLSLLADAGFEVRAVPGLAWKDGPQDPCQFVGRRPE